jgi:putative glutamine amidotransferase
MKPIIGQNADLRRAGAASCVQLECAYPAAITRAGGVPLILPAVTGADLDRLLEPLDGLVLVGGDDYHPALYGEAAHPALEPMPEARQSFDLELARAALARGLPVLGVCGGSQAMNLARGGSLVQDIASLVGTRVAHRLADAAGGDAGAGCGEGECGEGGATFHEVTTRRGSLLELLVGPCLRVNSTHHQAVARLGSGVEALAWAEDGVIEAIQVVDHPFALGVQWHPEMMIDEPVQLGLFQALIRAARDR